MSISLFASAVVASSLLGNSYVGHQDTRNDLIVNPAPVHTPTGRLWVNHTTGQQVSTVRTHTSNGPGPGAYGAPDSAWDETIYVRENHIPLAISPWQRLDSINGFARRERARVLWLDEQGYTHAVRTHVNTRARDAAMQHAGEIEPRAVIRVRDRAPAMPRLRAESVIRVNRSSTGA